MADATPTTPYDAGFFTGNARSAEGSARPILSLMRELYSPTSIVDVGCGSGGWLAVAGDVGFTDRRGYDGPWADPKRFSGADIDFVPLDLEKYDLTVDRRFDLAMSVEVAEHLTEGRSDMFVDALCGASDVILFGAAGPYQGGVHHVFERPQSYWIDKFDSRGYDVLDLIRPVVWSDRQVQWWFRQNTFVFVKRGSKALDVDALRARETNIVDIVHPSSLERRVKALWATQRELKDVRRQLDVGEKQVADLRRDLARERKKNRRLTAEAAHLRGTQRWRSKVTAKSLPVSVRPAAERAWRALPPSIRTRVRGN